MVNLACMFVRVCIHAHIHLVVTAVVRMFNKGLYSNQQVPRTWLLMFYGYDLQMLEYKKPNKGAKYLLLQQ